MRYSILQTNFGSPKLTLNESEVHPPPPDFISQ